MKTIVSLIFAGLLLLVLGLDGLRIMIKYDRGGGEFILMTLFLFFGSILTLVGTIAAGVSLGNSIK